MRLKYAICSAALLTFSTVSSASNLSFLGDSILADLNKADVTSLKEKIRTSLDASKDKASVTWNNDENNIKIQITPKLSYMQNEKQCRRTEFQLTKTRHQNEKYFFEICKVDNAWKVSQSPIKSFSQADLQSFAAQLYSVLDTGPYGVPSSWVNPKSKNSAVIVPLKELETSSVRCRNASVTIMDGKSRTADGNYIFCQRADGKWRRP